HRTGVRSRVLLFFFQAEDGIRGFHVTGVQTCALPIYPWAVVPRPSPRRWGNYCLWPARPARGTGSPCWWIWNTSTTPKGLMRREIGRASCRERDGDPGGGGSGRKGRRERDIHTVDSRT